LALALAGPVPLGTRAPCGGCAEAAERPRYGGWLRIETRQALDSLAPTNVPEDSLRSAAKEKLSALVFEGLAGFDEHAQPQPNLAISWQPDPEFKQWQFRIRKDVKFHDGTPVTPVAVARSLEESAPTFGEQWRVYAFGETVVLQTSVPRPNLPFELAYSRCAIFRRTPSGSLVGTGPFRIQEWTPGQRIVLVANEDYRGGRPYLDVIEVRMGRPLREQMIAFELGQADLIELGPDEVRRLAQGGPSTSLGTSRRVWSTAPVQLVTLVSRRRETHNAQADQAFALSIDRGSMYDVLLQKRGEVATTYLPQWLCGYSFVFSPDRDLERARSLLGEVPRAARSLTLAYDAADPLARHIAERVAVNAREAGFTVRVAPREESASADWILVLENVVAERSRPRGLDPGAAPPWLFPLSVSAWPQAFFDMDQGVITDTLEIRLFHLPELYGLSARIHDWSATRWGIWHLADAWLEPETSGPAVGADLRVRPSEGKP